MPKSAAFVHPCTGMQYGGRGARIAAWAGLAVCLICPSARAVDCMGDCDGSASVTVNELIMAVNISLALADPSQCDVYGGPVAINLLIKAVNNLLNGCQVAGDPTETPPEATATTELIATDTPTPPVTPDTPTRTVSRTRTRTPIIGFPVYTFTRTKTRTPRPTGGVEGTPTGIPTGTADASITPTEALPEVTATGTLVGTAEATATGTPAGTATATVTPDESTPTETASPASSESTPTVTGTMVGTATATITPEGESTATETATSEGETSATETAT